jgi:hypothetical protein
VVVCGKSITLIREVRAMERSTDKEELEMEYGLALEERDLALAKTRGVMDFAESSRDGGYPGVGDDGPSDIEIEDGGESIHILGSGAKCLGVLWGGLVPQGA